MNEPPFDKKHESCGERGVVGGVQISGRDARIAFTESFESIYAFRLLYTAGTQFPILGAMRWEQMEARYWWEVGGGSEMGVGKKKKWRENAW